MTVLAQWLAFFTAITIGLLGLLAYQPGLVRQRGGKALAFVAFCALPVAITSLGVGGHMEQSKSTEFCLSCHVMEPYGTSLLVDSGDHLAAVHFQNNWVPQETGCFTCHTQYTMYGDFAAKINGMKHVLVYYTGKTPEKLELYEPYQNRECLSCHGAARSFLEDELHVDFMEELRTGETSCLECHDLVHDVDGLEGLDLWGEEVASK